MAAVLEAVGDAIVRLALHAQSPLARVGFFVIGGLLLTLYGTSLNLAPVEFATVVGLYIATLFVTFQIANYAFSPRCAHRTGDDWRAADHQRRPDHLRLPSSCRVAGIIPDSSDHSRIAQIIPDTQIIPG